MVYSLPNDLTLVAFTVLRNNLPLSVAWTYIDSLLTDKIHRSYGMSLLRLSC